MEKDFLLERSLAETASKENKTYERLSGIIAANVRRRGYKMDRTVKTEDIIHDILLNLLKYDPEMNFSIGYRTHPDERRGYLKMITINRCNKVYRKERRYQSEKQTKPYNPVNSFDYDRAYDLMKLDLTEEEKIEYGAVIEKISLDDEYGGSITDYSQGDTPHGSQMEVDIILRLLPAKERQVFKLRNEGYSHKEIAEQLRISADSSRQVYSKGKKKLRKLLK